MCNFVKIALVPQNKTKTRENKTKFQIWAPQNRVLFFLQLGRIFRRHYPGLWQEKLSKFETITHWWNPSIHPLRETCIYLILRVGISSNNIAYRLSIIGPSNNKIHSRWSQIWQHPIYCQVPRLRSYTLYLGNRALDHPWKVSNPRHFYILSLVILQVRNSTNNYCKRIISFISHST